jgi:hypothetical protein
MPGINLSRRTLLAGMAAAPLLRTAEAQTAWPTKPVRVMGLIRRPGAPTPLRGSYSAPWGNFSTSNSSWKTGAVPAAPSVRRGRES